MIDVSGDGNKNIQINVNPSLPTLASIHVDPSNPTVSLGTNPVYGPKGEKGDKGDKGDQGEQGIQGEQGEPGTDGEDGFSPTANVVKVGNKATITITDKDGTTTADVFDGEGAISDVRVDGSSVIVNKIAEINLSGKQNITDNTLTTTAKTIAGAINEVNAKPSMPSLDEVTITTNSDDELQTVAVIDNNSGNALQTWTGTKAEYDAIITKDPNTIYNITDDQDVTLTLLETIYPVGSIYIGTMATCPLSALFGTWQLKASDRVLQGAGTRGAVGTTINESLPNIKGALRSRGFENTSNWCTQGESEAFSNSTQHTSSDYMASGKTGGTWNIVNFDASRSSSTYQDNAPVQQDAYLVNIWERMA